jgi:sensor c-di-GMP phosphodiesterase-like protein
VDETVTKGALEKIRDAVENRKDKAVTGSIWPKVVIGLLGVAAALAFIWVEWSRSRELAKALHEKTVRLVEQANATVAAANARDSNEAKKAHAASAAASAAAAAIDLKIALLEGNREKDKAHIDAIRSWDDLVGR